MHVHGQLRNAVVTAVTGLTTTGSRVFPERVYPLQSADLPGLCVWVQAEEAEDLTIHQPRYQRTVLVTVAGYAKSGTALEMTLDLIKSEVETALSSVQTVNGKSVYLRYIGLETDSTSEGDQPHGVATLTFRATLFTAAGQPDTLL